MNNLYKFSNITLLLVILVLSVGCSSDDRVFDETPQARKDAEVDKLNDLLSGTAFEGTYFPNDEKYGGSHMYFQFDGKGGVKMTSGFDEDTEMVQSDYEVNYNSMVELNFSTFNHITKLADNNLPDLRGTGFEGTNNFLFMGESEEGGVLLKDPRNKSELLLELISNNEFNDSAEDWAESIYQNKLHLTSPTGSVFQKFEIIENGESRNFEFNFNDKKLYGSATEILGNGDSGDEEFEFGIAFTPDGLTLSPPIRYKDQEIKDMLYNDEKGNFVGAFDGGSIVLGSADEPAFIPDDYITIAEDYLRSDNTVHLGQKMSHGDSPLTSDAFITEVRDKVIEKFESDNYTYDYFYFNTPFEVGEKAELKVRYIKNSSGSNYSGYYDFTVVKIEDNKIYYSYDGPTNSNGTSHEDDVAELIAFFENDGGFMFKYEGSFSTDVKSYSNPSVSATNMENPSQRVYLIVYP